MWDVTLPVTLSEDRVSPRTESKGGMSRFL
jgi:hypothetical protein